MSSHFNYYDTVMFFGRDDNDRYGDMSRRRRGNYCVEERKLIRVCFREGVAFEISG